MLFCRRLDLCKHLFMLYQVDLRPDLFLLSFMGLDRPGVLLHLSHKVLGFLFIAPYRYFLNEPQDVVAELGFNGIGNIARFLQPERGIFQRFRDIPGAERRQLSFIILAEPVLRIGSYILVEGRPFTQFSNEPGRFCLRFLILFSTCRKRRADQYLLHLYLSPVGSPAQHLHDMKALGRSKRLRDSAGFGIVKFFLEGMFCLKRGDIAQVTAVIGRAGIHRECFGGFLKRHLFGIYQVVNTVYLLPEYIFGTLVIVHRESYEYVRYFHFFLQPLVGLFRQSLINGLVLQVRVRQLLLVMLYFPFNGRNGIHLQLPGLL